MGIKNNLKGFTFAEIIVVIVIIGIMAMVAVPNVTVYFERAKYGEAIPVLKAIRDAQMNYRYETRSFTDNLALLDVEISGLKNFDPPAVDDVDPLASLDSVGGTYTLSIDEDGTIHCTDIGASGLCAKLKCTGGGGDECN